MNDHKKSVNKELHLLKIKRIAERNRLLKASRTHRDGVVRTACRNAAEVLTKWIADLNKLILDDLNKKLEEKKNVKCRKA